MEFLLPSSERANDRSKVDVLLVADDAEFELVVATRLNDRRITVVQKLRVEVRDVLLVRNRILHALSQFGVFYFLK